MVRKDQLGIPPLEADPTAETAGLPPVGIETDLDAFGNSPGWQLPSFNYRKIAAWVTGITVAVGGTAAIYHQYEQDGWPFDNNDGLSRACVANLGQQQTEIIRQLQTGDNVTFTARVSKQGRQSDFSEAKIAVRDKKRGVKDMIGNALTLSCDTDSEPERFLGIDSTVIEFPEEIDVSPFCEVNAPKAIEGSDDIPDNTVLKKVRLHLPDADSYAGALVDKTDNEYGVMLDPC